MACPWPTELLEVEVCRPLWVAPLAGARRLTQYAEVPGDRATPRPLGSSGNEEERTSRVSPRFSTSLHS